MPYMLRYPPGHDYILGSDRVWIGNDPTDNINLYDFQTLPHMAVIELGEQAYYITNRGTFVFYVNGNQVLPGDGSSLENGYEIRIGQSVITFFWVDDEPVYEYEPEPSSNIGWVIIPVLIVAAIVVIFLFTGHHF